MTVTTQTFDPGESTIIGGVEMRISSFRIDHANRVGHVYSGQSFVTAGTATVEADVDYVGDLTAGQPFISRPHNLWPLFRDQFHTLDPQDIQVISGGPGRLTVAFALPIPPVEVTRAPVNLVDTDALMAAFKRGAKIVLPRSKK